ncbi:hypothetical protein SAMN05216325_12131 [Nitrosomonas marina]|uniref:Uncharacterized protein n=1 Tax=Nitrosomonas marina TaxID=917 RepID=A0A1H8H464_9PROT|nr:hypothetical protein SAMN05216325_12131 [Nitrosomonas marina]
MPGAVTAADELDHFTIAVDEKVAGNLQVRDGYIVRMYFRIEPVGKEFNDPFAAEFSRRQADAVDDQQGDFSVVGALVVIG